MNALVPAAAPAQASPVKLAIDATWSALSARLRNLRRFALAALTLAAAAPLLALLAGNGWWLLGLAALPLLGFAYLSRERALVDAWENRVLGLWAGSDMYLSVVVQTLAMQPGQRELKASLDAMLALLPVEGRSQSAAPAGKSLARASAAARQYGESARALRGCMIYLALAGAGLAATLAAAVSPRAGAPALTAACACPVAWIILAGLGRKRLASRVGRLYGEAPWTREDAERALAAPGGKALPPRLRALLLEPR